MVREIFNIGVFGIFGVDVSKPNIKNMKKVVIDGKTLFEDDEGRLFDSRGVEV